MRVDVAVKDKLGISRQKAQALIEEGSVKVNGMPVHKPSLSVNESDEVEISSSEVLKYVGRGALKLEKALDTFDIDVSGLVCLDIGASTGGFTDCLLQRDAALVYALDVGSLQLDEKLRQDPRVISMENTDIREAELPEVDFVCMDISFISVTKVLNKVSQLLKPEGRGVILLKPQFEAGRSAVNKHGVVRDRAIHKRVINDIIDFAGTIGLISAGLTYSPIKGGEGNIEYLLYLTKNKKDRLAIDVEGIIKDAYAGLNR